MADILTIPEELAGALPPNEGPQGQIDFNQLLGILKKIPADKIALMMDQLDVARKEELHSYEGYEQLCMANNEVAKSEEEFNADPKAAVIALYEVALPKTLEGMPQNIKNALVPIFKDAVARPEQFKDKQAVFKKLLAAIFSALKLPAGWALLITRMVNI